MLGFGVVWWSLATILTPVAAKIGLPFLLVVRAFMGIGEVGSFITSIISKIDYFISFYCIDVRIV